MTLLAYPLSIFHSFFCNGHGFSVSFRPVVLLRYTTYIPSQRISHLFYELQNLSYRHFGSKEELMHQLSHTHLHVPQFDTIVLNLTNGESSIQALQEVYCNNLPFLCSFQMMGKEGFLLLDCRISMFETTTSFLKERVQTQDFLLFTTLRKSKSTPHRHCLTVEMLRLGKTQFEKKVQ